MQQFIKNKVTLFLIALSLWSNAIFADDSPGGIDGDPGAPVAPINNWVSIMIILAIALMLYFKSKRIVKA